MDWFATQAGIPNPLTTDKGGTGAQTPFQALLNLTVKGADMVAASTVDLNTATGTYFNVTGNTTITSFGTVTSGERFAMRFTGTPLITYNASSLILPGAANIQVVAGDTAAFESLGAGNWRCIEYWPISGRALIGGTPGSVLLKAENLALQTTGAAVDLATLNIPAGITRFRFCGSTGANSDNTIVTETQTGTPAAAQIQLQTAAGGGGNTVLSATAPSNGAGTSTGWPANLGGTLASSSILVVRQVANSANAATASFYVTIHPL